MKISTYDIIEFSKIYKRVMELELRLKECFKTALIETFPNKMFYRLIPYLKENLAGRYVRNKSKKKEDILFSLIKSEKSELAKLNEFIKMAYLSDILSLLTKYPAIYRDMKFNLAFYKSRVNFNNLKQNSSLLINLRNNIMHFNIQAYKENKEKYLLGLAFWEQKMICSNCFMHKLTVDKPEIKKLLKLLSLNVPNFFNLNDRIIIDLFDDLAYLNGVTIENLPSLWSIGRSIYDLKRTDKQQNIPASQAFK